MEHGGVLENLQGQGIVLAHRIVALAEQEWTPETITALTESTVALLEIAAHVAGGVTAS